MRRLYLALLLVACKTDKTADHKPAATPVPRTDHAAPPRPALPETPGDAAGEPPLDEPPRDALDVKRVEQLSPTLPNAKRMTALSVQAKFGQARESWCTSTPDATAAAKEIAAVLSHDGWSDVASRASGGRAAISAVQDGIHIAVTLGGTDAACKGGLMTHVVYHGATPTAPPLEPGEKIH